MTSPPAGTSQKLALDEDSFQQLLAAAYTLQKHNDDLRADDAGRYPDGIFPEIAALRSQILAHNNGVQSTVVDPNNAKAKPKSATEAAVLIAERLRRLTKAAGVAVCLIVDGYLRPTACCGTAAKVSGGSVASNSLVATERLRNGRAFQSANACSDIRLAPAVCVELKIGSLLAFPLERQNQVAGIIEVRWSKADAFTAGDERICQLMAELMSEVLEKESDQVNASVPAAAEGVVSETVAQALATAKPTSLDVVDENACRVCGKSLIANESFCANCGMLTTASDNSLQGKWASMWFMQQAQKGAEAAQGQGERLWPLHEVNAAFRTDPSGVRHEGGDKAIPQTDETEALVNGKRSPRNVLSVLKARFKSRAMGQ